jgi:hypothetical protein
MLNPMLLDDDQPLSFGQKLEAIEKLFSTRAIDDRSPVSRAGIDKIIKIPNVVLHFDSGLLRRIRLLHEYRFKNPPTPYPEPWKNFPVIDSHRVKSRMKRDEFLLYVDNWKNRARSLGAEECIFGDLGPSQFAVSSNRDTFFDSVRISMGPTRRAGKTQRGIWCDGWSAYFSITNQQKLNVGELQELDAFRDEFNTVARR